MSLLAHIGNTVFFMYQHKYNKDWDRKLNSLLDEFSANAVVSEHAIKLGSWYVWIENKWYAYGNAWTVDGEFVKSSLHFRPSIFTMMRLDKTVQKIKKIEKEIEKISQKKEAEKLFKTA